MLLCPVCHEPLVDDERGAACAGGHRFDRAREGYLYLLRSSKSGDSMGDPKSQARSRRDFLNRGYYAPLRDAMVELVRKQVSGRAAFTKDPMTLLRAWTLTGSTWAKRWCAWPPSAAMRPILWPT